MNRSVVLLATAMPNPARVGREANTRPESADVPPRYRTATGDPQCFCSDRQEGDFTEEILFYERKPRLMEPMTRRQMWRTCDVAPLPAKLPLENDAGTGAPLTDGVRITRSKGSPPKA
jgi:hypothetical protein